MSNEKTTVCFTCGLPVAEEASRLNYTPDGKPCPACRDRLLESLPPALPRRPRRVEDEPVHDGIAAIVRRPDDAEGDMPTVSDDDPMPA